MKKLMLSLIGILLIGNVSALSFEESRNRAWYLTDKMAYELNLTPEQYDKAYEINLNYFLNVNYASDIDGIYWRYRNQDLSYVLFDWQFNRFVDLAYFYRPLIWRSGICIMTTYDYYDRNFYYFNRPVIFNVYRGISWRNRPPRHSPYRNMTFSANGGMRERYGTYGHGYFFRNGERLDAPRYNGEHYGRRDRGRNPGRDFDKGMNYGHRNPIDRPDRQPKYKNDDKTRGEGNNYRDKKDDFRNNSESGNGNKSQGTFKDRILPSKDHNNLSGQEKYVSNESNTFNTNNKVAPSEKRNNSGRDYRYSDRTISYGERKDAGQNPYGKTNGNRTFSQRAQYSSNNSRNSSGTGTTMLRNTTPRMQTTRSATSPASQSRNTRISTRSFGK